MSTASERIASSINRTGTVADIPDEELLRLVVGNARHRRLRKSAAHPRWTAIADMFGLGSTYSHQLCRRFGFDPDEMVRG